MLGLGLAHLILADGWYGVAEVCAVPSALWFPAKSASGLIYSTETQNKENIILKIDSHKFEDL